ncbi:hypothetical protein DDQ41_16575 [Streptomyces spongiicola]|uniref:Integral membrane bound transporter domain-containing protein n=1 Tax=Streptomyces spongiicola TaxID=1690221 RepID=A0ABM6V858_9ACTN|nr:FUSC family protein [Streptomyces spongiicola]AWK10248.1 hypothetical protein DDQ41_16575 [Streptomyces spongiicola]
MTLKERVRLAPPAWLVSGLRPQRTPVNRAAVARASVALSAPLAVGFALDRPVFGALVSIGALSGVIGDTADAYRMRLLNIAVPQVFGAVGVTLGTVAYGRGWLTVAVLTLVALVSGMISSIGAVASASGLLLLLNAVIGSGLPLPRPWWAPPLLLGLGGLFVLALALLGWPLRGGAPERSAVARAYRAVADLLDAAGCGGFGERRRAVTQSLNDSYDLILARRATDHVRNPSLVRLLAQLNALIPVVEAALAADQRGRPLPPDVVTQVRMLADAVEHGPPGRYRPALAPPATPTERAVDHALRHAAGVVLGKDPDPHNVDDRLGRPAALGVRVRGTAREVLFSEASWRYGLRLALCVGLAQTLVSVVELDRSYWVPLTVTFVLKPDFGSVFSRAVGRGLGTVAGLVVAAAVLAEVPRGWWDVPVMFVLGGLIPAFSAKGYAFQTAAITPVILLLSDLLSREGIGLVGARLVDSLIGCAIVLVAGYLLWPESWHSRIGDRLADSVDHAARHVALAFSTEADHAERARSRRRLYRDLSAVRSEFQRALTEPPPAGTRAAAWWPLVVAVERIADATTAAGVRVDHGAAPPARGEVDEVVRHLRELAGDIRSREEPAGLRAEPGGDERSVLEPVRQEVAAARMIASPSAASGTPPGS